MRKTKKVMAVVLASAMALAMNVSSVFAAESDFPVGKITNITTDSEGVWTVTVGAEAGKMVKYDIGVVYDPAKIEVAKDEDGFEMVSNVSSFKTIWDKLNGVSQNFVFADADKSYVVIAGTQGRNDSYSFAGGDIATVTFKAKSTDVKEAEVYLVPQDASGIYKSAGKLNVENVKSVVTDAALVTLPPVATEAPVTEAPVTDTPVTDTPVTDTPVVTDTPGGDTTVAPISTQKAAESAAPTATATAANTTTNTTKSAKTGDTANVVIPMIAICAAAAAVVVASKKRVEE